MRSIIYSIILMAIAIVSVSAQTNSAAPSKAEAEIRKTLQLTADGWNKGDLRQYLAFYTPDATEMLATGPKGGVEAIEETMKQGFWKSGRPEQSLRYESLLVRMLGKDGAVVTGQYILSGAGKPDRKGWFTTVWIKTKAGWRMMHDHS